MAENVSQHCIPRSYLNPWRIGRDLRRVRVFELRRGMQSTRYARGLFSIDDLYTRHHSDGSRDLSLDNALKKLENDFGMIKPKIQSSSVLAGSDAAWLIAFAAAMYARTP